MGGVIDYLTGVARAHEVSPLLFILVYAVSTPPFLFVTGWLFHHIRRERPLEILLFFWALFYSAPYLYVLIVGRHLPVWVYVLVAALILGGLSLAWRGLMRRLGRRPPLD